MRPAALAVFAGAHVFGQSHARSSRSILRCGRQRVGLQRNGLRRIQPGTRTTHRLLDEAVDPSKPAPMIRGQTWNGLNQRLSCPKAEKGGACILLDFAIRKVASCK